MSNRLTSSSGSKTPGWIQLFPFLFAGVTACLVFLQLPAEAPMVSEEAHPLYLRLPSPLWVGYLQAASLLLVFLFSGWISGAMVPPKSPGGGRVLARCLGMAIPAAFLTFRIPDGLGPQTLFPAWALALGSLATLLHAREGLWQMMAGLSGLLAGLALTLHALSLVVLIPAALWAVTAAITQSKTRGLPLALFAVGTVAGLFPVIIGVSPFALGITGSMSLEGLAQIGTLFLDVFTWWSLPFFLLAFVAAVFQRQGVFLGVLLPILVLELLLGATFVDPLPEEQFFLLLPMSWLLGYGVFRLAKGIEQGIRSVNRSKATATSGFLLCSSLVLYGVWTLYILV